MGAAKYALAAARQWADARVQWGHPIARHEAIATKLAFMAATTYGMTAMLELCCRLADAGGSDIRIEAALVKLYASEMAWRVADELVQIRGGRGYETAESLAARGERPIAAEQMLRDLRINRIFEGSTEIMHLFIAREAVDTHLSVAGDLIDPDAGLARKARAGARAGGFYASWLPTLVVGRGQSPTGYAEFGPLAPTCGTWSGVAASSPDRCSLGWRAGKDGWSTGRRSSAGWSTSAPSCSRCPLPVCGLGRSGPPTRKGWSWPTCSAGRPSSGSTPTSITCGTTPTRWMWPRPVGWSTDGTPGWKRASCRCLTGRGWPTIRWAPRR